MSVTIAGDQILPVNSTSYIDMLGVMAGLTRIPGEDNPAFAQRIELAVTAGRGPEYTGLINALLVDFALEMSQAIQVSRPDGAPFDLTVTFGQLALSWADQAWTTPLLSLTSDDFWSWKQLSDVAAEIAAVPGFCSVLNGDDGPALTLIRQANGDLVVNEALSGARSEQLQFGTIVPESVVFNQAVPAYTVKNGRTLQFSGPVPDGTSVTYRYRQCPFWLAASPVAAFALTDPAVQALASGSNGKTIYQVREYLQEILLRDSSYWGA